MSGVLSLGDTVRPFEFDDGRVRVVIESIEPPVDGGRFPIKRIVGETVVVEADFFADGHDVVARKLKWCSGADGDWQSAAVRPLHGIYGPAYELLEHEALHAGGEEYLHSEKFERRVWDRSQPHSLAEFIAVLNRIRRANPALQSDAGLRFLEVDNEQLVAYVKTTPDGSNTVVCIVNLDPHHTQSGWVELDRTAFGMQSGQAYQLHDPIGGAHYLWHGARNYVSLDPRRTPVHVMQVRARMRRENDFEYFL